MSDSDYDGEVPTRNARPVPAPSGGGGSSGLLVGGVLAGVAIAGAVGLKLVLGGSKPKASSSKSSGAKAAASKSPAPKKTVSRRAPAAGAAATAADVPEASGAAAPAATAAAAAPAANKPSAPATAAPAVPPSPQRSAAPVLPKRTPTKTAAPAAPAVAAAAQAAEEATTAAAAAEKAAAAAAAQEAAAEAAAAQQAAEEQAAAAVAKVEQEVPASAAEEVMEEEEEVAAAVAAEEVAAPAAAEEEKVQEEAAPAAEQAAEAPAAAEEPAAAEAGEQQEEGEGEEAPQIIVHVLPQSADITALVLPAAVGGEANGADATEGAAAAEAADGEAADADAVERLGDIEVPSMSFEGAPTDGEFNEVESKARQMSLHAHQLVKEKNNIAQGAKEQKAALDVLLAEESAGKARPTLVAACAFALGDMLLAQKKLPETKQALAIAYQAASHLEDKGPQVRALMNYAYITKAEKKLASTQATYEEAIELARQTHGPLHGMVEKIKYELTAFLGSTNREAEAANMLISSAAELLAEAEKLAAEEESKGEGEQEEGSSKAENGGTDAATAAAATATAAAVGGEMADPGTGLEHLEAEGKAEGGEGEEDAEAEMTPVQQAQHFAMRNLMNAAGVLDGLQQYERGEELLARALDIAVVVWGQGSMQHLNVMYALAQHFRRRGMLQESIDFHEQVLAIMDESISVYSPELLQNRISILRDVAVLMDKAGHHEAAVDYATGALVNAQTLAGIMSGGTRLTNHPILEPFYRLLADLKAKIGDEEGAAEARRMANEGRLNQRLSQVAGKQQQQRGQRSGGSRRTGSGASTARAGGRRV